MSETFATLAWLAIAIYAAIGACVALPGAFWLIRRIFPGTAAIPFRVRLLVLPGMILLWPVVLRRLRGLRPAEDQS